MGWMTMNFLIVGTNNTLLMRSTSPKCTERLDLPELTTFCLPPTTELIGNPLTDCNYVYLESPFCTPLLKCRYTKSNKCDHLHPRSSTGERSGHSQYSIRVSLITRRGSLFPFLQLSASWFLYSIVPVLHYHVCAGKHTTSFHTSHTKHYPSKKTATTSPLRFDKPAPFLIMRFGLIFALSFKSPEKEGTSILFPKIRFK